MTGKNVLKNARTAVYVDYIPQSDRGRSSGYYCIRRKHDSKVFYGYHCDITGRPQWDRLRYITHVLAPVYTTNRGATTAARNFGFKVVKKPISRS